MANRPYNSEMARAAAAAVTNRENTRLRQDNTRLRALLARADEWFARATADGAGDDFVNGGGWHEAEQLAADIAAAARGET